MFSRARSIYAFLFSVSLGAWFEQLRLEFPEMSDPEIKEALALLCGGGMVVKHRDIAGITYRAATPDEMLSRIYSNARMVGEIARDE